MLGKRLGTPDTDALLPNPKPNLAPCDDAGACRPWAEETELTEARAGAWPEEGWAGELLWRCFLCLLPKGDSMLNVTLFLICCVCVSGGGGGLERGGGGEEKGWPLFGCVARTGGGIGV